MFRLMTTFTEGVTEGDGHSLKNGPRLISRFGSNLGPLFEECPHLGALPYTLQYLKILMRCLSLPPCRKKINKKLQALKVHLIQG
jgi:hypothetical protein